MQKKVKETVYVRRSIAGISLVGARAGRTNLLLALFGGDPLEIGKPIQGSLDDVLTEVREVADGLGITMSICGNRERNPTIQLWGSQKEDLVATRKVFEGLSGDAAHSGIVDFYGDHETALRVAILSGEPFTTGWYCVKKEVQSGRVTRTRRNGSIEVEVSLQIDDPEVLAGTAFWKAAGGNGAGANGREGLLKLGMSEARQTELISLVAQYVAGSCVSKGSAALHWKCGYAKVCRQMEALAGSCDRELEGVFESCVEYCSELIEEAKLV